MTATRKAPTKASKSTSTGDQKVVPIKKVRPSLPNAMRRNETTHEDGAAAVAGWACQACGSKKGTRCLAATGEPTSYVHADRMRKLDASKKAPATGAVKATRSRKATSK